MLGSYTEIRDWLESFIPLVYGKEELGLARIENLLEKLGNPQKSFKSILVGGTAGKGSTAFYISRLLQYGKSEILNPCLAGRQAKSETNNKNSNFQNSKNKRFSSFEIRASSFPTKVGLHLSPHLIYIGERMQVNGVPISVKRLVALANEIKPVVDAIKSEQPELLPSYFEILVALSFLYFAKEKVEWAVVEVGLGGRLDATNILTPEICVITNVGLDHAELLGDTVEKIAREKAGIIKIRGQRSDVRGQRNGVPVVTGAKGKALEVIEKEAKNNNSKLINIYTQGLENIRKLDLFRSVFKAKDLNCYIPYYVNNECALLALSTVLELKTSLSDKVVKKAFSAKFDGRFEEIAGGVIVDGAHNTDKIKVLIDFIQKAKGKRQKAKVVLVVAFKKGKNWQEMIGLLMQNLPIKKIIATEYKSVADTGLGSAVEPEEIAEYIDDRFKMIDVRVINNSQEAVFNSLQCKIYNAKSTILLVTGSLYLVGEVRTIWYLPEF